MNIEKYREIKQSLPENVRLIAVSKFKPASDIKMLYDEGQRAFGENKAQEMKAKHEVLPQDIEWHFIGTLQTNKIKYIAPYVTMIHSIDRAELLREVNKHAAKVGRIIPCLLQFHIAEEETKHGFLLEECEEMLRSSEFGQLQNVSLHGVMGMATFTDDMEQVRGEFRHLHDIYLHLKETYFQNNPDFKELSMGMTDDYPIAIEEGSTMVRIGSAIFGARDYNNPINVI
ncbi:MAG: YggS family pyridoxal phosphate-dependent enzyme [Bacteroidales bacterium]|nr:YggS family pyridoxal phosphate-dependent enzyme [Bacteroidales bacterium]